MEKETDPVSYTLWKMGAVSSARGASKGESWQLTWLDDVLLRNSIYFPWYLQSSFTKLSIPYSKLEANVENT